MTRLLILAALAAGALLAWLNVRDLRLPWRLYGYESGHSQVTGHHPWWLHVLSRRYCVLCALGFRRRASSGQQVPDPMDAVQGDPWPGSARANVEPALDPDPPYLEAMALVNMRRAYGGNPLANT